MYNVGFLVIFVTFIFDILFYFTAGASGGTKIITAVAQVDFKNVVKLV